MANYPYSEPCGAGSIDDLALRHHQGGQTVRPTRMSLHFTPFELFAISVGDFWPVSLVVVALLVILLVKRRGWVRVAAASLVVILVSVLVSDGIAALGWKKKNARDDAQRVAYAKRMTVTLTEDTAVKQRSNTPQNVTGVVPRGSTLRWVSEAHDGFYGLDLARPARFIGVNWQDRLTVDNGDFWSGVLSGDQTFQGWPCRDGGWAEFDGQSKVVSCVLAKYFRAAAQVFPAGLTVSVVNGTEFYVPEGGVLQLGQIGFTVMPHQSVLLDDKNRISSVNLDPDRFLPDPIAYYRGVPIRDTLMYAYADHDAKKTLLGVWA